MTTTRRRGVKVAVLGAVATIGSLAASGAVHADYYDRCIAAQRRAYNQDVRDVGRFWADVVWVGREWACRNGITQL
jgi:hypothetical protein